MRSPHVPALLAIALASITLADAADARSIRVDSGDWDLSGFITGNTTESLGFNLDILGVNTSQATISSTGRIDMSGGGEALSLLPFFDPAQTDARFQFGVTNAAFSAAGVDAGFRVTWQFLDSLGQLQNEYQASIWSLSGGSQFAIEYNYNQILAGSDASQVGYDSSTDGPFDLPGSLGLSFNDYNGIGNDEFNTTNCANTPNALACNNFFAGTFGPGVTVLPNTANGFFRQIDSNGGTAQGRALFLFDSDTIQVPEPSSLSLSVLALLALAVFAIPGPRRLRRIA